MMGAEKRAVREGRNSTEPIISHLGENSPFCGYYLTETALSGNRKNKGYS
jgi:hypothetical protein